MCGDSMWALACSRAYGPVFGLPENNWIAEVNEYKLYTEMPLVVGLSAHSSWPNITQENV